MPETRKESRLPLVLAVRYREPTMVEAREAECQDLATGGMFVMTARPSARGALLRFDSISAAAEDAFGGTARVVWQRNKADQRGPAGMGVRFIRLEPGSREVVMRLVARLAAEQNPGSSPPARRSSRPPKQKSVPSAKAAEPISESTNLGATQQGIGARSEPSGLRAATLRGISVPSGTQPSLSPPPHESPESAERNTLPLPTIAPPPPTTQSAEAAPPFQLPQRRTDPSALRERLGKTQRADTRAVSPAPGMVGASDAPGPPHPSPIPTPLPVRALSETIIGVGTAPQQRDRRSERPPSPGGIDDLRPIVGIPIRQASDPAPPTPAGRPASEPRVTPSPLPAVGSAQATPSRAIPEATAPAPTNNVRIDPPAQHAQSTHEAYSQAYVEAESASPEPFPPRGSAGQHAREPIAALPAYAGRASTLDTKRIAWIVVGAGLAVSFVLSRMVGGGPSRLPALGEDPAAASGSASTSREPLDAPTTTPETAAASAAPRQYAVDVGSEPSGARVSAAGKSVVTPGRLNLGTLTSAITATAELAGYRTVTAQISPAEFNLEGDLYLRKLVLKLDSDASGADTAPTTTTPESTIPVGISSPSAPKNATAAKPTSPQAKPTAQQRTPKHKTVEPVPAAVNAPTGKPSAPDNKTQSPLEIANACLAQGDNLCVIRALEDHAKTARASEMLIETYRAIGSMQRAEQEMKRYLHDFPGGKRAAEYQRRLGQHVESAP